jgi:hypothetical protein
MKARAPRPWSPADLPRLLSPPRFARYVSVAGSAERAADLYSWNGRLSGAVHEELGMLEVATAGGTPTRGCHGSRPR